MMELFQNLRTINVFATLENDLRKIVRLESANGDFQCVKLENALKFCQKFFDRYHKIRNLC